MLNSYIINQIKFMWKIIFTYLFLLFFVSCGSDNTISSGENRHSVNDYYKKVHILSYGGRISVELKDDTTAKVFSEMITKVSGENWVKVMRSNEDESKFVITNNSDVPTITLLVDENNNLGGRDAFLTLYGNMGGCFRLEVNQEFWLGSYGEDYIDRIHNIVSENDSY